MTKPIARYLFDEIQRGPITVVTSDRHSVRDHGPFAEFMVVKTYENDGTWSVMFELCNDPAQSAVWFAPTGVVRIVTRGVRHRQAMTVFSDPVPCADVWLRREGGEAVRLSVDAAERP